MEDEPWGWWVTDDADTAGADPPAPSSAWPAFETAYDAWQSLLFVVVGHEAGTLAASCAALPPPTWWRSAPAVTRG